MTDCLFCKIVAGEIPSEKVAETDSAIAFRDINPAAPVHVLVIPKEHLGSAEELSSECAELLGELFDMIGSVVSSEGVSGGWRLVANTGEEGGQTVHHLHFHVLGGRGMGWPPG